MPDTQWQVISDFSPGIRQQIATTHPLGTAQEQGTFRCFTRDGGVLTPLPKRTQWIMHDEIVDPSTLASEEVRVIGLHAKGPVFWPADPSPGVDQNNDELLVGFEYWTGSGDAANRTTRLDRYLRHYQANPSWQTIWQANDPGAYDPRVRPKNMGFQAGRSNSSAANSAGESFTAGPAVLAVCVSGHLFMYPDDTDTLNNTYALLPGSLGDPDSNPGGLIAPDAIVAHQGRLVVFPLLVLGAGHESVLTTNEAFYWLMANNWTSLDNTINDFTDVYFRMQVGWENPTGYHVMQSLTSSQLLLLKSRGGGVMLSGDLNNPRAEVLPYVRSPGLSMNRGCNTPVGFVYPVDGSGVWLWSGGGTSEHVTKHMEPDFWRPPATDRTGNTVQWGYGFTQCDSFAELVMFPNNWVWDTDGGGWWRSDDLDEFVAHRWATNVWGTKCYATTSGVRNAGDPVVAEFDARTPWDNYSWQSQPLSFSTEREVSVKQLVVVASGSGRVKVRVSSQQNPDGTEVECSSDADGIWQARRRVAVTGTHLQARIIANAGDGTSAAPDTHELRLEVGESRTPKR